MLKRLFQSSCPFLSESKQIVSRKNHEKTRSKENESRKVAICFSCLKLMICEIENESRKVVAKQKRAVALTKEKGIQAFIRHVLINQHHLFSFNTATKKSHKIPMLEFRNHRNFIHKLFDPLTRCFRKSFDSYFLPIW